MSLKITSTLNPQRTLSMLIVNRTSKKERRKGNQTKNKQRGKKACIDHVDRSGKET